MPGSDGSLPGGENTRGRRDGVAPVDGLVDGVGEDAVLAGMVGPAPGGNGERGRRPIDLVFWAFFAMVVLSPLFLGGARPFIWPVLSVGFGLVLIAWACVTLFDASGRLHRPVPVLLLGLVFSLVFAWGWLQAQPGVFPQLGNPIWKEIAPALGGVVGREAAVAVDPTAARRGLIWLATLAIVFFLAVQLGSDREKAQSLFLGLLVAGGGYALYGLAMTIGGIDYILWMPKTAYLDFVTSTFVNRNHFATYAGLVMIVGLGLTARAFRREARRFPDGRHKRWVVMSSLVERHWLILLAVTVSALALGATQSRGGLFATALGLGALGFLLGQVHAGDFNDRRVWRVIFVGLAMLIFVFAGSEAMQRFGSTSLESTNRDEIYAMMVRAIAASPQVGYGLGSFPGVAGLFRDTDLEGVFVFDYGHNIYLELTMDLGVAGAALYFAVVAAIAAMCWAGAFHRRRDAVYPVIGVAATVVAVIHSLVDFSLQIPGVAVTYAAIVGVAFAQSWSSRKT